MAFCLLLVIVAELPHLRDDAWEDEAATLMLFASGTPLDAFRDYRLPNNHMLFSATLAAWWSRGESVEHARLLPALAWVLSMVLMVMGGRRLLGWPAAAVGIGVWSGAALTAFFALALRGYAFSWPFVLTVFACAPGWVSERAWRAGLATAAAGALAFMILPTNGIALASALAFALLCDARAHGRLRGTACMRALTALALAAGGLVVYVPHRAAMMAHMQGGFSTWSSIEIMTHWWLAASSQCLPLLPVLAWGAWRARRAPAQDPARAALDLALVLMVVPLCAVAASPVALVPRALVPLLPLWCLALGGLLAAAVSAPQLRCRVSVTAGCALLVVAAFACGRAMPDCAAARRGVFRRVTICAIRCFAMVITPPPCCRPSPIIIRACRCWSRPVTSLRSRSSIGMARRAPQCFSIAARGCRDMPGRGRGGWWRIRRRARAPWWAR